MTDQDHYRAFLEDFKDKLMKAANKSGEPLAPLMVVADLSIMVLVDMCDGDFQKFVAVYDVYLNRIEKNIDKEVERRKN